MSTFVVDVSQQVKSAKIQGVSGLSACGQSWRCSARMSNPVPAAFPGTTDPAGPSPARASGRGRSWWAGCRARTSPGMRALWWSGSQSSAAALESARSRRRESVRKAVAPPCGRAELSPLTAPGLKSRARRRSWEQTSARCRKTWRVPQRGRGPFCHHQARSGVAPSDERCAHGPSGI